MSRLLRGLCRRLPRWHHGRLLSRFLRRMQCVMRIDTDLRLSSSRSSDPHLSLSKVREHSVWNSIIIIRMFFRSEERGRSRFEAPSISFDSGVEVETGVEFIRVPDPVVVHQLVLEVVSPIQSIRSGSGDIQCSSHWSRMLARTLCRLSGGTCEHVRFLRRHFGW